MTSGALDSRGLKRCQVGTSALVPAPKFPAFNNKCPRGGLAARTFPLKGCEHSVTSEDPIFLEALLF